MASFSAVFGSDKDVKTSQFKIPEANVFTTGVITTGPQTLAGSKLLPYGRSSGNDITGVSKTFALDDAGKFFTTTKPCSVSLTVPPYNSVAFPKDTEIEVCQGGSGQVTFVAGNGVTINCAKTLSIFARYGVAKLKKSDNANTWLLSGELTVSP